MTNTSAIARIIALALSVSLSVAVGYYIGVRAGVNTFLVVSDEPWRFVVVRFMVIAFLNLFWFAPDVVVSAIELIRGNFSMALLPDFETVVDVVKRTVNNTIEHGFGAFNWNVVRRIIATVSSNAGDNDASM